MDFKLERTDGTPSDPPTYKTGVYAWRPGDTIPLGATGRSGLWRSGATIRPC